MKKEGFHEDEYYSYWTSAGYAEILPSGYYDWRTGSEMQEQFMVSEGAAAFCAIAPSGISNVMFARMYGMSAMWNVLYACVLLMAVKSFDRSRKKFGIWIACGTVICYLSFLTHYFSLLLPGLMIRFIMCIY